MYNWMLNLAARTEERGADTANTDITSVTGSATADVKGSYVDIGAVTEFTYELVTIIFFSNVAVNFVFDLAINVGGNRFDIATDLHLECLKINQRASYVLPLHVPAGSQMSVRCAASVGSSIMRVNIIGHSSGLFGAPGYSRCLALYVPNLSRGIDCDPGASAHTKSRTEITASTPERVAAMMVTIGSGGDIARSETRWLLDVEAGAAGSEQVILPNMYLGCGATNDVPNQTVFGPFPCDVPKSTRLAVNPQCQITTAGDRTLDICLHGFVP